MKIHPLLQGKVFGERDRFTETEELHLLCFWEQMGSDWGRISQIMGKSYNSIRNAWEELLKREGINEDKILKDTIELLIIRLKTRINSRVQNAAQEELKEASIGSILEYSNDEKEDISLLGEGESTQSKDITLPKPHSKGNMVDVNVNKE
jgi:hypothetical protein